MNATSTSILFAASTLAGFLTSCHTCKSVDRQDIVTTDVLSSTHSDSVRILQSRVDSVTVRDSVVMLVKGDTIFLDRWHWRDRILRETNRQKEMRTDTVWSERLRNVTKTRVRHIEKKLTWWQRFRLGAFWWLAGCLILSVIVGGRRKLYR